MVVYREKMAAAKTFLLVLCVLLVSVGAESEQLTILHSYPEPGNFSYVELVCVASDSSQLVNDSSQLVNDSSQASSVVSEARFQLNGTDIGEDDEIVENLDNGTIQLLLTQQKEGFFTCSHNEFMSTNSIGLAGMSIMVVDENDYGSTPLILSTAEPSISSSLSVVHTVVLLDSDSTVSTVLECDIKPGALTQRYFVQWFQVSSIHTGSISSMFNFSLSVNSSFNVKVYQCEVTVNHDGHHSFTYTGKKFIIDIQGCNNCV